MKRRTGAVAAVLTAAVLCRAPAAVLAQQAGGVPDALLVAVQGSWTLTSGGNPGQPRTLDPKKDIWQPLMSGDRLKCTGQMDRAVVQFGKGDVRAISGAQCTNGYTVPAASPAPARGATASVFSQDLQHYYRIGGLPRSGFSGFVLWPVEEVLTRPQTASRVQWRAQPRGVLTLTLRAGSPAQVLWTRTGIDAATGGLQDPALETALAGAASRGDLRPLLEVRSGPGQPSTVVLSLISEADDSRVRARTAAVAAGVSDPLGNLLRADVLLDAGLQREALDEYVAALGSAPEAAFLLRKAADLAGALGDPRAADLRDRAEAAASP